MQDCPAHIKIAFEASRMHWIRVNFRELQVCCAVSVPAYGERCPQIMLSTDHKSAFYCEPPGDSQMSTKGA